MDVVEVAFNTKKEAEDFLGRQKRNPRIVLNQMVLIEHEILAFNSDLSGMKITDVKFAWKTDFSKANLSSATFQNCDLSEATFDKADLSRATFQNCDLSGTIFNEANLNGAKFSDCLLGAADFTDVELDDKTSFTGCHYSLSLIGSPIGPAHLMDATKKPLNVAIFPKNFIKQHLLTISEFADEVGLKPQTVKALCQYETLKGEKHGRDWRIPRSEIDRYRKEIHGRPGHKPELIVTVRNTPNTSFGVEMSIILADELKDNRIEYQITSMIESNHYDMDEMSSLRAMKDHLQQHIRSIIGRDVSVAVVSS